MTTDNAGQGPLERRVRPATVPETATADEPVYWQWRHKRDPWTLDSTFDYPVIATTADTEVRPLYAHPQQRKPLTQGAIDALLYASREADEGPTQLIRRVEAAHDIRETK